MERAEALAALASTARPCLIRRSRMRSVRLLCTNMDTDATFKLSDVFPPQDAPASLARFLVVARQARALQVALASVRNDSASTTETSIALIGCYIASLKELADAFRDIDGKGDLSWVERLKDRLPDLHSDILTARAAVRRDDPASLYARLLKRVRDTAGFHVPRGVVQKTLEEMKDDVFHGADTVGSQQEVVAVPLVTSILAHIIWGRNLQPGDLTETMDQAEGLHRALSNVAHDLYLFGVKIATRQIGPAA